MAGGQSLRGAGAGAGPVGMRRCAGRHPPKEKPLASKLNGDGEAQLIALACSRPPAGYAKWTMQLYADKLVELQVVERISDETVRRTLKKWHANHG